MMHMLNLEIPQRVCQDNLIEVMNQLFASLAWQLVVEQKMHSPVYHPQSNERIGEVYNFLRHVHKIHFKIT